MITMSKAEAARLAAVTAERDAAIARAEVAERSVPEYAHEQYVGTYEALEARAQAAEAREAVLREALGSACEVIEQADRLDGFRDARGRFLALLADPAPAVAVLLAEHSEGRAAVPIAEVLCRWSRARDAAVRAQDTYATTYSGEAAVAALRLSVEADEAEDRAEAAAWEALDRYEAAKRAAGGGT